MEKLEARAIVSGFHFAFTSDDFETYLSTDFEDHLQIGVVFLGGCSKNHSVPISDDDVVETGPSMEAFEEAFEELGTPRVALLISQCCGSYSEAYVEGLKNTFPTVKWITPEVLDYSGIPLGEQILYDLVRAGIVTGGMTSRF